MPQKSGQANSGHIPQALDVRRRPISKLAFSILNFATAHEGYTLVMVVPPLKDAIRPNEQASAVNDQIANTAHADIVQQLPILVKTVSEASVSEFAMQF